MARVAKDKIVLYAVDSSEVYQELAYQSIKSLRKVSPKIPIQICIFGKIKKNIQTKLQALGVQIAIQGAAPKVLSTGLKWYALATVANHQTVLFVDADTYFFHPVEKIFKKYAPPDFCAHIETATQADAWRGEEFIPMRIKKAAMRQLRKKYHSRAMPVYNSSVMLFNRGLHRRILLRLPIFTTLFWGFRSKKIPYPCTMIDIAEEVCGSIILGQERGLSHQSFHKKDISHYNAWRWNKKQSPGVIMHIGNSHIQAFLKHFQFKKR